MNKRGSHIDVIISFIIFISFIVFTYALLQPTLSTKQDKENIANSLESSLVNNLSGGTENLTIISLFANQQSPQSCINFKNFLTNANITAPTIIVKNPTGAFTAYNSGSDLYVASSPSQHSNFFNVYYSSTFNQIQTGTLSNCNTLQVSDPQNNYTISQSEVISNPSQRIIESNVIQLINYYKQNYVDLQDWFNLSALNNFGFNFTYQNQTNIGTNDKPAPFSTVYSQAFPVLYLTGNSSLQSGFLTVRVW